MGRRLLVMGDSRTYRIPGRVLYGGFSGETPLGWRLATQSWTPAEVRKRVRQWGVSTLLYNCVTVDWLEVRYGAFEWDRRSARLYEEFCRSYLVERWHSTTCDYVNGGLYLFDLAVTPRVPAPATIPFAPGIEGIFADATLRLTKGDVAGATASYLGVRDLLPEVGQAWDKVGHALIVAGRPREALPYLRRFGDAGLMDAGNLPELAAAEFAVGHVGRARQLFGEVEAMYPTHPLTVKMRAAQAAPPR
jgi:hypothetical protein